jgi:hypothetical protein
MSSQALKNFSQNSGVVRFNNPAMPFLNIRMYSRSFMNASSDIALSPSGADSEHSEVKHSQYTPSLLKLMTRVESNCSCSTHPRASNGPQGRKMSSYFISGMTMCTMSLLRKVAGEGSSSNLQGRFCRPLRAENRPELSSVSTAAIVTKALR